MDAYWNLDGLYMDDSWNGSYPRISLSRIQHIKPPLLVISEMRKADEWECLYIIVWGSNKVDDGDDDLRLIFIKCEETIWQVPLDSVTS